MTVTHIDTRKPRKPTPKATPRTVSDEDIDAWLAAASVVFSDTPPSE